MKRVMNFDDFLKEKQEVSMSADEIIDYITSITPDESDVPDFFFSQIKKSGKRFILKNVNIEELLDSDLSLKEYVNSGEERYGENGESDFEPEAEDLDNPIVVFNGEVVDGYNRTAVHYRMGEKNIKAYISQ